MRSTSINYLQAPSIDWLNFEHTKTGLIAWSFLTPISGLHLEVETALPKFGNLVPENGCRRS